MVYPPQGVGIGKNELNEALESALKKERRKARLWKVSSLILGVIAVIEPFLLWWWL